MVARIATSLFVALAILAGIDAGRAQTCESLRGGSNCAAPGARAADLAYIGRGTSKRPAGVSTTDLISSPMGPGASDAAMFGSITTRGTCSGPFRVRRC
jgi:hypothetical protein